MSYMGPNPFSALQSLQSGLDQLKSGIQSSLNDRVAQIFVDIDAEQSPVAYGIKAGPTGIFDLLDRTVHAIAELEKRLPEGRDNAA